MNSTMLVLIYVAIALVVSRIPYLRVYISLCNTLVHEVICVCLEGGITNKKEIRNHCINQIKNLIADKQISQSDMFIFPASLGVENWKETIEQFSFELNTKITEAPGMPPNATAIRLYERLKK